MKQLLLTVELLFIGLLSLSAHEVNRYMYFCLDVKDNPYGIEKRLLDEFQKVGFFIMDHNYYNELDATQQTQTLFAEYDYYINYNGNSSLTIVLKNALGEIVWSQTGYGCTFLSAKGDMKKCIKQIMQSFGRLNYKFDESLTRPKVMEHPFSNWNTDDVKTYLRTNKISSIEGIYKNYSNDGHAYNIAILKKDDKYYGIIIDSDNQLWKQGDTKIILHHIERNLFDAEYYYSNHQKLDALATLKNNRLLEFSAPYNGDVMNFSFLKIYPSENDNNNFFGSNVDSHCKKTGSGVLISDNIIITNYHVVNDAAKVEAIININGVAETFDAKILSTDKTNDLAIVYIKDEKYKSCGRVPFKILEKTADVGTSVFTMGFPMTSWLGEEMKVTDGIISSKSGFDGDIVTYQISVPIQPGNSGGPLFDKQGNLVGITNAKINANVAENVGYAIKSSYVLNAIDSAPINITVPVGSVLPKDNLPELIKALAPYVVYLKVY